MLRTFIATLAGFTSTAAMAHAGHDHSHWLSEPIHALSVLSIVSIVTITAVVYRRNCKRKLAKNKIK